MEVANVLTISVPSDSLAVVAISFFLGVEQRLHSLVVGAFVLHEVYDVELVRREFLDVGYSEVKPLGVDCSVMVIFQNQVVVRISNFNGSPEVSRLKSTFKNGS